MKRITFILPLSGLIVLSSCDSFEKRFYNNIYQGQINAVKNGFDTFDLSKITDFDWDSVLLIRGDESVSIIKEEIEEILNNRVSEVHWEDRRSGGKTDDKLIYKTTDLEIDKDRFYFLTPDKKIIEKEIKSGYKHRPAFDLQNCLTDLNTERYWLTRAECKFVLESNVRTIGEGTVFLFPNCRTRFLPHSIKFHSN